MRISQSCADCLYQRQKNRTDNTAYLAEIKAILDNRKETDTSPYMVYLFNQVRMKFFGAAADYSKIKKQYNNLFLSMETDLRQKINSADDPLATALIMARIGNYIDFGAMDNIDHSEFLALFRDTDMRQDDAVTYASFLHECADAETFLLICDNCGEIVLDKLMLEQLKIRFSHLSIIAMVRGGDVLNDATVDDAHYVGLDTVAEVISNGKAVGGTIYEMLTDEARSVLDNSDVILAKGQGNYESMSGQGRHVFYEFLCKCELFTKRFNVPRLTGMFIEENE